MILDLFKASFDVLEVQRVFAREEMVDRFDTPYYLGDLEDICREQRGDPDLVRRVLNSTPDGCVLLTLPAWQERLHAPLAPEHTHALFGYDATTAWETAKAATADSPEAVQKILELQGEYSYLGGRRGEDRVFHALHRPETGDPWTARLQRLLRAGALHPEEPCLTLGPRWAGEVRYFRDVVGLKGMGGLDLYTFNEGLIVQGDMHAMPFPDNHFGLVYQRNTFNKSYDIRKALRECVRVLRPGGVLVSDDCYGYTHGVSPLARTNIRHNRWIVNFLQRNAPGVKAVDIFYDVETRAEEDWHRDIGQLMVRIHK